MKKSANHGTRSKRVNLIKQKTHFNVLVEDILVDLYYLRFKDYLDSGDIEHFQVKTIIEDVISWGMSEMLTIIHGYECKATLRNGAYRHVITVHSITNQVIFIREVVDILDSVNSNTQ